MNSTTKGIIAVLLVGGVAFAVYKLTAGKKKPKVGSPCNNFGGGPDGVVVFTTTSPNEKPTYYCKRCNESGCRTEKL
jgi:hypothetical protein